MSVVLFEAVMKVLRVISPAFDYMAHGNISMKVVRTVLSTFDYDTNREDL